MQTKFSQTFLTVVFISLLFFIQTPITNAATAPFMAVALSFEVTRPSCEFCHFCKCFFFAVDIINRMRFN